jgi:Ca-activated chloride channel family protein
MAARAAKHRVMNTLYWRDPLWALLGLLPACWLLLGYFRTRRWRRRYADPALWPWALGNSDATGKAWRRVSLALAWLLLGLAAAGPRLPAYVGADAQRPVANLMLVLDLSRSMHAQDVWPSRLGLAQLAAAELLPQLAATRCGLVVTAGRPHQLWPLSSDRAGLAALISELGEVQMPSEGSDLAGAVRLALQTLSDSGGERVMLLLTDGDLDAAGQQALEQALAEAAAAGIRVVLTGIGSPAGAAIPGPDGDWLRDASGQPQLTRLADATLAALAARLDAAYLMLPTQQAASTLRAQLPDSLARLALDDRDAVLWHELFGWLLIPAVLLWILASLRLSGFGAPLGVAVSAVYLLGLTASLPGRADPLAEAYRALQRGDAAAARQQFAALPGYAARMGTGSSCHQLQDWACARQAFGRAVLVAPDDDSRARAIYNLAHTLFQLGDYSGAAQTFDDALRYRHDYPAARHNRDFAAELAAEVARLAGGPQAGRRGRGPATGPASDAESVENARLRLAGAQQDIDGARSVERQRPRLLDRGLSFVRLATDAGGNAQAPWSTSVAAHRQDAVPDISLWQTLIDRAEGLQSTPQPPRVLPGMRPW